MKRLLYLGSIILVLLAVIGIGSYLKRPSAPAEQAQTPANPIIPGSGDTQTIQLPATSTPPSATSSQFGIFVNEPVSGYFVKQDNSVVYVKKDGQVVLAKGSEKEVLSANPISGLTRSSFSFDGKYLFIMSGNSLFPQFKIFNTEMKEWEAIDIQTFAASWSPTDNRLAMIQNGETANKLVMRTLEDPKKKYVDLGIFPFQDQNIAWVQSSTLILSDRPHSEAKGSILRYNLSTKTFATLLDSVQSADAVWEKGEAATYGFTLQKGASRGSYMASMVYAADGFEFRRMNFATLPSKCAFAEPTPPETDSQNPLDYTHMMVCAVPQANSEFILKSLPEEWDQKAILTKDTFYSINPSSDIKQVLTSAKGSFDAMQLQIANGRLFFVNRYDNKVYGGTL